MKKTTIGSVILGAALSIFLLLSGNAVALDVTEEDYDLKLLGKYVFFDKISSPKRMACVTCHDPATGGTGSVSGVNLHEVAITGANPHTVGNLKPPTNAYATFIIPFQPCNTGGLGALNVCGGNFWDGRAEGNVPPEFPDGATKHIGDEVFQGLADPPYEYAKYFGPTADQALNPMPNPVEQNIDRQAVCQHVESAKYAELYWLAWGEEIDCRDVPVAISAPDVDDPPEKAFDISFKRIMLAVCAWQASADLNSFSSKRDMALRAELACLCAEGPGPGYPGDDVCDVVGDTADPSVCMDEDYMYSPGEFPLVGLTDQENYGHDLFYAIRGVGPVPATPFVAEDTPCGPTGDGPGGLPGKISNCAFCHSDNPPTPGAVDPDTGAELFQLYSADDYHNIGTPRNLEIPETFNIEEDGTVAVIDPDLGVAGHEVVDGVDDYPPGFFKTPILRNVDKRKGKGFIKAYTHNGWFKSLESIVHFYNTAFVEDEELGWVGGTTANLFGVTRCPPDVETERQALKQNCWPAPAYGPPGPSAIPFLVGNLGLSSCDEAAIVAYLKTLTDEYTPKPPRPYKRSKR
jgi:cytochrome c peroxidase